MCVCVYTRGDKSRLPDESLAAHIFILQKCVCVHTLEVIEAQIILQKVCVCVCVCVCVRVRVCVCVCMYK